MNMLDQMKEVMENVGTAIKSMSTEDLLAQPVMQFKKEVMKELVEVHGIEKDEATKFAMKTVIKINDFDINHPTWKDIVVSFSDTLVNIMQKSKEVEKIEGKVFADAFMDAMGSQLSLKIEGTTLDDRPRRRM